MKKWLGRVGLALLGVLPLIGGAIVWQHSKTVLDTADSGAKATSVTPVDIPDPLAPLLSARRTPTFLAVDIRRRAYSITLAPVVKSMPKDNACFVVSIDGIPVLDAGGSTPVVPASNLKLFTAAVALDVLGPDYTFTTQVSGTLQGDTVQGDLSLIGGGDPLLSTQDYINSGFSQHAPIFTTSFEALADQIKTAGVTHITGRILGDNSRYDSEAFDPNWTSEVPNRSTGIGPTSALLLNDGWVNARTGIKGDATKNAAQKLHDLLVARGVKVDGGVDKAAAPAGLPVITQVQSAKLTDILHEMLTNSDNNTAENLLREIGWKVSGKGTRLDGAAAAVAKLTSWGITGVTMVDGSGLDHANKVTCEAMVAVLAKEGAAGPFHDAMAIAGKTGTMEQYFKGTPLDGVLYAKTGTLNVAKALSGYLPSSSGTIEFALIFNAPEGSQLSPSVWQPVWSELPAALTQAPPAPPVDILAPGGA